MYNLQIICPNNCNSHELVRRAKQRIYSLKYPDRAGTADCMHDLIDAIIIIT